MNFGHCSLVIQRVDKINLSIIRMDMIGPGTYITYISTPKE